MLDYEIYKDIIVEMTKGNVLFDTNVAHCPCCYHHMNIV